MNLPNVLTLFRVAMIPLFVGAFLTDGISDWITLSIFAVAAITDALDGYIARKQNIVTDFGKLMDPLADKMLTTSAFLGLMSFGRASAWAVMLILTREFIVSGIRLVAAGEGNVIAASIWGKLKTVFQMVAIIASILLLYPIFSEQTSVLITDILIWLSAIITVISGADYVIKNLDVFRGAT